MMTELQVLLTQPEIASAVRRLAGEISSDYRDKNPLVLGVLKGSFIFLADLVRLLDFPLEVDFVTLSSYKEQTESCGDVSMDRCFAADIKDRHVLVVEDIVDTGLTLHFLLDHVHAESPASLRLCALLNKPLRRKIPVSIDYLGFTIPDKFVVGYGTDCAEKYRNLPDIRCIENGD
ncbi:MAG: hypoxanthine phosphoribosyltransferase [Dehalococcoidia bacterium]|nr:MAG: hypoxanthine phosphoribosyltransferase [Dehalococcoidia bacterium]